MTETQRRYASPRIRRAETYNGVPNAVTPVRALFLGEFEEPDYTGLPLLERWEKMRGPGPKWIGDDYAMLRGKWPLDNEQRPERMPFLRQHVRQHMARHHHAAMLPYESFRGTEYEMPAPFDRAVEQATTPDALLDVAVEFLVTRVYNLSMERPLQRSVDDRAQEHEHRVHR